MSPKAKSARKQARDRTAPKKASYHHGALRDALIRSAREILESDGYEALTLRAAARRAGVSQAAPYNHFADKAALLDAIAALGFKEFAAAMRREMECSRGSAGAAECNRHCLCRFCHLQPRPIQADVRLQRPSGHPAMRIWMPRAPPRMRYCAGPCIPLSSGPRRCEHDEIESLRSWAFVHGLATMINEGTIAPGIYGARSASELIAALLGAPQMEKNAGVSTAAIKRRK